MAYVALLWKARIIEKYRQNYEREKQNSIRIMNAHDPKRTFYQKLKHYNLQTRDKISKTLLRRYPKGSKMYNFCYYLKTDQTFPNFVMKSVLGFVGGMLLTYLCFLFFVFQLSISLIHATIMSSVIGVMLTLGLAFSYRIRCLVLLLIPQFFSRVGRYTLTCYALILILTGPATNTLKNSEVLTESLACGQEQIKTNLAQINNSMVKPYHAVKDNIKDMVNNVQMVANYVRDTARKFSRLVLSIAHTLHSSHLWLTSVAERCDKKMGNPYQRCMGAFEKSVLECKMIPTPALSKLCDVANMSQAVCSPVKQIKTFCHAIEFSDGNIVDTVIKKLKSLKERLNSMLYANVRVHHTYFFSSNLTRSANLIAAGICTEIRNKADLFLTWLSWSSTVTSASLLLIIFRAKYYQHMYETRSRFDNRYITKELRDLDLKRLRQGKPTVLPLNKREEQKYIKTTSLKLLNSERTNISRSALTMAITTFKLMIHMVADYSLYWVLITLRKHGMAQTPLQPESQGKAAHVAGSGFLANILRSLIGAISRPMRAQPSSLIACIPDPHPPDFQRYGQIGILICLLWFFALFEPYGLRLRHVIMGLYRPERAKARAIWLYNHIQRTRASFLKFARRKLHKEYKYRSEERHTLRRWLDARMPCTPLKKLLGISPDDPTCLLCGEVENFDNLGESLIRCKTPNCPGTFCTQCFSDLGELCTICLSPADYGDMSDVSLEKDTSDDSDDDLIPPRHVKIHEPSTSKFVERQHEYYGKFTKDEPSWERQQDQLNDDVNEADLTSHTEYKTRAFMIRHRKIAKLVFERELRSDLTVSQTIVCAVCYEFSKQCDIATDEYNIKINSSLSLTTNDRDVRQYGTYCNETNDNMLQVESNESKPDEHRKKLSIKKLIKQFRFMRKYTLNRRSIQNIVRKSLSAQSFLSLFQKIPRKTKREIDKVKHLTKHGSIDTISICTDEKRKLLSKCNHSLKTHTKESFGKIEPSIITTKIPKLKETTDNTYSYDALQVHEQTANDKVTNGIITLSKTLEDGKIDNIKKQKKERKGKKKIHKEKDTDKNNLKANKVNIEHEAKKPVEQISNKVSRNIFYRICRCFKCCHAPKESVPSIPPKPNHKRRKKEKEKRKDQKIVEKHDDKELLIVDSKKQKESIRQYRIASYLSEQDWMKGLGDSTSEIQSLQLKTRVCDEIIEEVYENNEAAQLGVKTTKKANIYEEKVEEGNKRLADNLVVSVPNTLKVLDEERVIKEINFDTYTECTGRNESRNPVGISQGDKKKSMPGAIIEHADLSTIGDSREDSRNKGSITGVVAVSGMRLCVPPPPPCCCQHDFRHIPGQHLQKYLAKRTLEIEKKGDMDDEVPYTCKENAKEGKKFQLAQEKRLQNRAGDHCPDTCCKTQRTGYPKLPPKNDGKYPYKLISDKNLGRCLKDCLSKLETQQKISLQTFLEKYCRCKSPSARRISLNRYLQQFTSCQTEHTIMHNADRNEASTLDRETEKSCKTMKTFEEWERCLQKETEICRSCQTSIEYNVTHVDDLLSYKTPVEWKKILDKYLEECKDSKTHDELRMLHIEECTQREAPENQIKSTNKQTKGSKLTCSNLETHKNCKTPEKYKIIQDEYVDDPEICKASANQKNIYAEVGKSCELSQEPRSADLEGFKIPRETDKCAEQCNTYKPLHCGTAGSVRKTHVGQKSNRESRIPLRCDKQLKSHKSSEKLKQTNEVQSKDCKATIATKGYNVSKISTLNRCGQGRKSCKVSKLDKQECKFYDTSTTARQGEPCNFYKTLEEPTMTPDRYLQRSTDFRSQNAYKSTHGTTPPPPRNRVSLNVSNSKTSLTEKNVFDMKSPNVINSFDDNMLGKKDILTANAHCKNRTYSQCDGFKQKDRCFFKRPKLPTILMSKFSKRRNEETSCVNDSDIDTMCQIMCRALEMINCLNGQVQDIMKSICEMDRRYKQLLAEKDCRICDMHRRKAISDCDLGMPPNKCKKTVTLPSPAANITIVIPPMSPSKCKITKTNSGTTRIVCPPQPLLATDTKCKLACPSPPPHTDIKCKLVPPQPPPSPEPRRRLSRGVICQTGSGKICAKKVKSACSMVIPGGSPECKSNYTIYLPPIHQSQCKIVLPPGLTDSQCGLNNYIPATKCSYTRIDSIPPDCCPKHIIPPITHSKCRITIPPGLTQSQCGLNFLPANDCPYIIDPETLGCCPKQTSLRDSCFYIPPRESECKLSKLKLFFKKSSSKCQLAPPSCGSPIFFKKSLSKCQIPSPGCGSPIFFPSLVSTNKCATGDSSKPCSCIEDVVASTGLKEFKCAHCDVQSSLNRIDPGKSTDCQTSYYLENTDGPWSKVEQAIQIKADIDACSNIPCRRYDSRATLQDEEVLSVISPKLLKGEDKESEVKPTELPTGCHDQSIQYQVQSKSDQNIGQKWPVVLNNLLFKKNKNKSATQTQTIVEKKKRKHKCCEIITHCEQKDATASGLTVNIGTDQPQELREKLPKDYTKDVTVQFNAYKDNITLQYIQSKYKEKGTDNVNPNKVDKTTNLKWTGKEYLLSSKYKHSTRGRSTKHSKETISNQAFICDKNKTINPDSKIGFLRNTKSAIKPPSKKTHRKSKQQLNDARGREMMKHIKSYQDFENYITSIKLKQSEAKDFTESDTKYNVKSFTVTTEKEEDTNRETKDDLKKHSKYKVFQKASPNRGDIKEKLSWSTKKEGTIKALNAVSQQEALKKIFSMFKKVTSSFGVHCEIIVKDTPAAKTSPEHNKTEAQELPPETCSKGLANARDSISSSLMFTPKQKNERDANENETSTCSKKLYNLSKSYSDSNLDRNESNKISAIGRFHCASSNSDDEGTRTDTTVYNLALCSNENNSKKRDVKRKSFRISVTTKSNRGTVTDLRQQCDASTVTNDWWSPMMEKKNRNKERSYTLKKKQGMSKIHEKPKKEKCRSVGVATEGRVVTFRSIAQVIPPVSPPSDILSPSRYLLESQKYYNELFLDGFSTLQQRLEVNSSENTCYKNHRRRHLSLDKKPSPIHRSNTGYKKRGVYVSKHKRLEEKYSAPRRMNSRIGHWGPTNARDFNRYTECFPSVQRLRSLTSPFSAQKYSGSKSRQNEPIICYKAAELLEKKSEAELYRRPFLPNDDLSLDCHYGDSVSRSST